MVLHRLVSITFAVECIVSLNAATYLVKQTPHVLHMDVEPHALDEWDTNKTSTANQLLDLIDKIQHEFTQYNSTLSLRMDIPRWYDNHNITRYSTGVNKELSSFILDKADVMIMNYVDDTRRFVRDAENELIYADSLITNNVRDNVRISISVETACIDPLTATFCDDNTTTLETVLQQSYINFTKFESFEEVAIHDWDSYNILQPIYTINSIECDNGRYRALYVWEWNVVLNITEKHVFLNFCRDHCVNKIYLESQSLLSTNNYKQQLAMFLNETYEYGIEIELVLGYYIWALEINHNDCLKYVDWAIQFVNNLIVVDEPVEITTTEITTTAISTITEITKLTETTDSMESNNVNKLKHTFLFAFVFIRVML
eukprot:489403_1